MSAVVEELELSPVSEKRSSDAKSLMSRDFSLVGHVMVDVEVRVGTADISLNEFFATKVGSVIKLNEPVSEPVTLFVNGKPIGRGVLVAVGENFGVRVTELAD